MAVDQGSLRYKIELESEKAIQGLDEFRRGLLKSRRSFRAFREDVSRLGTGARQLKNTLRDLAKVTVEGAEASVRATKALNKSVTAQREANKEHKKAVASKQQEAKVTKELTVVEQERLKLQKSLAAARARLQNKELRNLVTELAVVRKISSGYQKLAVAKKLSAQGRDLQTGLKPERLAELKVLEAQNALTKEQALLNNKELQTLTAQLAVQRQIAAAEAKQTKEQLLQQQGRGPTGLTTEQEAATRFAAAKHAAQVKEMVDQMKAADPFFQKFNQSTNRSSQYMAKMSQHAATLRSSMSTLTQVFHRARTGANRVFFTFRRLIGIFAAFLIVRKVIQAFNALIAGAVKYNAAIEQSILGIASLITATGEVRTAIGGAANAQDQLALAIKESRRQIALLRKDALTTVATFRQLVDTYQIALGPGIAAGLDVDQIRNFTIQISQAAAAIGLAQNQLAEEIRSILQGTIQLRTTRIAAVLGITNADIKNAKEMGVLAEFLNDRFRAFTEAGKEALSLYNAIIARLGDAINELLRQGSSDFFMELKDLLSDILNSLVEIEDTGITINPKALVVVTAIFDGMRRAVAEAQRLRKVLNVTDLAAAADALGRALGTTAEILGAMVEGVIAGFKDVAHLIEPIAEGLSEALPEIDLQDFVRTLTEALVVITAMKAALGGVLGIVFFILTPVTKLVGLFTALIPVITSVFGLLSSAVGAIATMSVGTAGLIATMAGVVVAAALIGKEIIDILEDVTGVEIKFETWVKIIKVSLVAAFKLAAATLKVAFLTSMVPAKAAIKGLILLFRNGITAIALAAIKIAEIFGADVGDLVEKRLEALKKRTDDYTKETKKDAIELRDAYKELAEAAIEAATEVSVGVGKAMSENTDARTFDEMVADLKAKAKETLGTLLAGLKDSMSGFGEATKESKEEALDLVAALNQLPGIVSSGTRGIQGLAEQIQRLEASLRQTSAELQRSLDSIGLQGPTLEQRRIIAEEEFKLKEEARKIDLRLGEVEKQKLDIKLQALRAQKNISDLNKRDRALAEQGLSAGIAMLSLQDRLNAATQRLENTRALIIQAQRKGHTEALAQLKEDEIAQQKVVGTLSTAYAKVRDEVEYVNETFKQFSDTSADIPKLILERIKLLGLEKSVEQDIVSLLTQRSELENIIAKRTLDRIRVVGAERRFEAKQNLRVLSAELAAERSLYEYSSALTIDIKGKELAEARAQLLVDVARRNVIKETLNSQIEGNAKILAAAKALHLPLAEQDQLRSDQLLQENEIRKELELQEEVLKRQAAFAEEARRRKEEPISFGLETGAAEFSQAALDDFERFVEMGKTAIQGFADFISSSIADAFDPSSDTTIAERFQQFLAMLSNMIIEYLVNKAIGAVLASLIDEGPKDPGPELLLAAAALSGAGTTLTTAAGSLAGASGPWYVVSIMIGLAATKLSAAAALLLAANSIGAASGGVGGGATGRAITRQGYSPSQSHMRQGSQSFAGGGRIRSSSSPKYDRPAGIDPRDTEPIWARVGEWVISPEAVAKYGNAFMDLLNRGLIDPMLARGISGARRSFNVSKPRQRSFATGGAVRDTNRANGNEQVTRAVLVADEATFERLLAAGSSAQLRWIENYSDEIRTLIS